MNACCFYNRRCLESCSSVEEATSFVQTQDPLGPYHLSVADEIQAKSFHFFQGELTDKKRRGSHFTREGDGNFLITANCNYTKEGLVGELHSIKRHAVLDAYFQDALCHVEDRERILEAAFSLPYVNNDLTIQTVIMQPRLRKMKVAFDNAFAGGRKLHQVDVDLV
jgi:hypothetical protein